MTEDAGSAAIPHLHAPGLLLLTADRSYQALQEGPDPGIGYRRRLLRGAAP